MALCPLFGMRSVSGVTKDPGLLLFVPKPWLLLTPPRALKGSRGRFRRAVLARRVIHPLFSVDQEQQDGGGGCSWPPAP